MVWYGIVRYGMVWYGMVWYGIVWYGMAWNGMVSMVWHGMVWYGMVWYAWWGMTWHDIWYDIWYMIWYDMIWFDMIWYDMIWYDMIWYAMLCYAMLWYVMICNFVDLARKTLLLSITSSIASCQNKLQTVPIFPKETLKHFILCVVYTSTFQNWNVFFGKKKGRQFVFFRAPDFVTEWKLLPNFLDSQAKSIIVSKWVCPRKRAYVYLVTIVCH